MQYSAEQYNAVAQQSSDGAVPAPCRAVPTPSDPSMRLLRAIKKERKVTRPDSIRLEKSLRESSVSVSESERGCGQCGTCCENACYCVLCCDAMR